MLRLEIHQDRQDKCEEVSLGAQSVLFTLCAVPQASLPF